MQCVYKAETMNKDKGMSTLTPEKLSPQEVGIIIDGKIGSSETLFSHSLGTFVEQLPCAR